MSNYTELIDRLRIEPTASQFLNLSDLFSTLVQERKQAAKAIEALQRENAELRKDAQRYRWLRLQPDDFTAPRIDICHWTCENGDCVNNGEGLRAAAADEAIDAAMLREGASNVS